MKKEEYTQFDVSAVYKELVEPKMKEIADICEMHGIPFFASFGIKNGEAAKSKKGTDYVNFAKMPGSSGICLMDDKLTAHMKVEMGFEVYGGPAETIDMLDEAYDDPFAGLY